MSTEIVKAGGALAIRADQTEWTPEQVVVLRQAGVSEEVTAAELSGFLHLCQRTQLDPFSRQIYLIGRKDKRAGRVVFTPQTGIDGYRVVAHRAVAEARATFGYEDTQWCDSSGRWRDVWLAAEPPAAVKVTVIRNGQRFPAIALYREYVQTGWENKPIGLWGKMPAGQLAKCAEALALRKAFPHDLAGVYTAEEMAQADNAATPPERHLRQVQPGEGDPWATTAAPQESVAVKGRSQPAQEFADVAAAAKDQSTVKDIYRQANAAGLLGETVKTADRELMELGAYLIAQGQQFSEPAAADDGVVDAEVIPDADDEHTAAVADLRAFAADQGLTDLDRDAESALGLPLDQASARSIRDLLNQLRGTAA